MKTKIIKILPWAYVAVLIACSFVPGKSLNLKGDFNDKAAHFAAFVILGFLMSMGKHFTKKNSVKVIGIIIGIAIITEAVQIVTPGRDFSVLDICADLAGGVTAFLFSAFIFSRFSINRDDLQQSKGEEGR